MFLLLTLILLFFFIYLFSKKSRNISFKTIVIALFYHLVFCNMYYFMFLDRGSDARNFYYNNASLDDINFNIGGQFVVYIMHFPIKYLDASFYGMSIFFGSVGFFGLVINYITIKGNAKLNNKSLNRVMLLLLFFPGLNFWTSAPGKDSLIYFFISIFVFSIFNIKRKIVIFLVSLLFISLIRPQIGAIIIFSMLFALVFHGKVGFVVKYSSIALLLGLSFSILPYIIDYVGLSEVSLNSLEEYVNKREGYNQGGGSSIDISNASAPVKIFGYLFRPLFFDAHGLLGLFSSFENIIYLYFFTFLLSKHNYYKYIFTKSSFVEKFIFIYIVYMTIILSFITANLGIASRQKTMFIEFIIFLFVLYKLNFTKRRRTTTIH